MYKLLFTNKFKKDFVRCEKRNYQTILFEAVVECLENNGKVPAKYKPHRLSGNYINHWECHIKPDWLLIWLQDDFKKEITLIRMGTHADLFD
ncbi:MAG: type II toxin-antitoxin system YafQ family toxin [Bacteroidales bacterium]|nr:type II toxin-antitoxin system YafQ family toxin [Bacteroidales bacterium]